MSKQKTIDEFTDYVDRSLDSWASRDEKDIMSLAKELAELIRIFHFKKKYLSIALEGFQGTGKTTTSIIIAKEYYGSWEKAFDVIRFDLNAFIDETLRNLENGFRPALRILDDFAFQGVSKWRRTTEQNDLLEYAQVIRTAYTCLIYSYVDDSVAKFFRLNAKIKMIFNMVDPDTSEIRVYTRRYSSAGVYYKRVATVIFNIEEFRRNNPEFVELYELKYEPMRRQYTITKGKKIKERMDRRNELVLAGLIGYYAARFGKTVLDVASYLRSTFNIGIPNDLLPKLGRKAREYIGIYGSENGNGNNKENQ